MRNFCKVNVYITNGRVKTNKCFDSVEQATVFANEQTVFSYNKAVAICYGDETKVIKGVRSDLW